MALTEYPFAILFVAALLMIVFGTVHAAANSRWRWVAVQLVLPPIGSIAYLRWLDHFKRGQLP
jgi:hypothetical protein